MIKIEPFCVTLKKGKDGEYYPNFIITRKLDGSYLTLPYFKAGFGLERPSTPEEVREALEIYRERKKEKTLRLKEYKKIEKEFLKKEER